MEDGREEKWKEGRERGSRDVGKGGKIKERGRKGRRGRKN